MNIGFEESSKEELHQFLGWHKENLGAVSESEFDKKIQFKNGENRRVAYHTIDESRFMIAEDMYTHFYHDFYDK